MQVEKCSLHLFTFLGRKVNLLSKWDSQPLWILGRLFGYFQSSFSNSWLIFEELIKVVESQLNGHRIHDLTIICSEAGQGPYMTMDMDQSVVRKGNFSGAGGHFGEPNLPFWSRTIPGGVQNGRTEGKTELCLLVTFQISLFPLIHSIAILLYLPQMTTAALTNDHQRGFYCYHQIVQVRGNESRINRSLRILKEVADIGTFFISARK